VASGPFRVRPQSLVLLGSYTSETSIVTPFTLLPEEKQ
jgi:hypothetical protein